MQPHGRVRDGEGTAHPRQKEAGASVGKLAEGSEILPIEKEQRAKLKWGCYNAAEVKK